MVTTTDCRSETADVAHLEPIRQYHDFYARLYGRAAIVTFAAAGPSFAYLPWPVSAFLLVGGTGKALLWLKHHRSKRAIEAGSP